MNQDFLGPNQQGPDIKRLVFAVVLMTITLMVFNTFFSPKTPQVGQAQQEAAIQEKDQKAPLELQERPAPTVDSEPDVLATPQNVKPVENTFKVEVQKEVASKATALKGYEATLSNLGGAIIELNLIGYEEPVSLLENRAKDLPMFALYSPGQSISLEQDSPYEVVSKDDKSIVYERMTKQGIRVRRIYTFQDQNFLVEQKIVLKNEVSTTKNFSLALAFSSPGLAVDRNGGGFFSPSRTVLDAICRNKEERDYKTIDALKDEALAMRGGLTYAAYEQQYFLTALVPAEGTNMDRCSGKIWKSEQKGLEGVTVEMESDLALHPGESKELAFTSYVGPKQLGLLQQAGNQLDENVNFGWFGVLARPMLWLLSEIYSFVGNFGIAIILLTLLIKLLTFPLTQKSFVSMQAMKKVAPQLKEIQKKYSHDRVLLGQKQMELYQNAGINPMAGCLPLLIQMPIWFALYQMLWNSVELHQQPFALWIQDLTRPDPLYVMPVVMGISMMVQQYFQPAPDDNPQMKYMMWGMPFFLTFIMLSMPAGLSLYILVNNVLTIFQQLYIKRKFAEA